jgi:hypothetical protein
MTICKITDMTIRTVLITLTMLVVLGGVAVADDPSLAKPTDPKALEHMSQGNRHYRVRDWDKAIEQYKAGALIEDAPIFLYNLAQSYRQAGKLEDAIWHYERFITRANPTGDLKTAIDGFIKDMRAELDKQKATNPTTTNTTPTTTTPTDGTPITGTTDTGPTFVDGKPAGMSTKRKAALAVGAVGLVAIGGGVFFGLRAKGFEKDADELCPMEACATQADVDEANDLLDKGKSSALLSNISFGVGGAALVGAAILWFTGGPPSSSETAIAPSISPTHAGLAWTGRF